MSRFSHKALAIGDRNGHRGAIIDRVNGYDVIQCEGCGFRHVLQLPTHEELRASYTDAYYRDEKPNYVARSQEDAEWQKIAWQDRLSLFEDLLEREPTRPFSVLDIGCGPGWFLKEASARGWTTQGVEPSKQAATFASSLGLSILNIMFDETTAPHLEPVDVVHLNNMLEHVADPIGLLRLAIGRVWPGGLICVGVPNDYNGLQEAVRAGGAAPWWLAPPHHLNYFDFESLSTLLSRLGLDVLESMTSFPMELFLLMGENYVGNDALGRECHSRRKRFDTSLEVAGLGHVRRKLYSALAKAGLGREAILIARKRID